MAGYQVFSACSVRTQICFQFQRNSGNILIVLEILGIAYSEAHVNR